MAIYLYERTLPHAASFLVREVILRIPESSTQVIHNKGYKILWVIYGSVAMELSSGETYVLRPGDVMILPQGCTQYLSKSGRLSQDSLHVVIFYLKFKDLEAGSELGGYVRKLASAPRRIDVSGSVALWELYCDFRKQFDLQIPLKEGVVSALFRKWLVAAVTAGEGNEGGNGGVDPARLRIVRNGFYGREAEKRRETPATCEWQGSNDSLGVPLREFARKAQVEKAKILLMNRNLPVETLARESGYRSVNTFYRDFQAYTGMSPKAYRDSIARKVLWDDLPFYRDHDNMGRMDSPEEPREHLNDLRLSHAKEYIRKNLLQPLNLEGIAWAVNLSEEHLSRMFRETFGLTVMDYIRSLKVHHAKQLLVSDPRLSLEQIAERTGFSTTSLFCRVFKEVEHCTPGAFRKRRIPCAED